MVIKRVFYLVGVLASVKQLRKRALDTAIWVLQKGAKAEDMGEGSVPGRILLGYTSEFRNTFDLTTYAETIRAVNFTPSSS